MRRLPQSTSRVVTFAAFLSSDHVSIATGKTIAITISKNGGAFANPAAGATNATEIGSTGIYKVTLGTGDTDTLGDLWVHGTAATIDNVDFVDDVVSATNGGLTNLDGTVTSRMATYTQPTGFLAATFPNGTIANTTNLTAGTIATVSGNVNGSVGSVTGAVGSVTGLTASNLDATVSSRLAGASYTAPDNTSITAIKAKTDSLTFSVAAILDCNIQYVNDVLVTGNGSAGTPWGP